jgi:hypothetical protein
MTGAEIRAAKKRHINDIFQATAEVKQIIAKLTTECRNLEFFVNGRQLPWNFMPLEAEEALPHLTQVEAQLTKLARRIERYSIALAAREPEPAAATPEPLGLPSRHDRPIVKREDCKDPDRKAAS